jgi:hypothetical protein
MPKFGKYTTADAPQTGLGAFPSQPSNISQNTQPSADNVSPGVDTSAGEKVLSSQEIYDILKKNSSTTIGE